MTDKKKAVSLHSKSVGLVAQLDRVPDYGSGGCGFDSRPVHKKEIEKSVSFFHFIYSPKKNIPFPPSNPFLPSNPSIPSIPSNKKKANQHLIDTLSIISRIIFISSLGGRCFHTICYPATQDNHQHHNRR